MKTSMIKDLNAAVGNIKVTSEMKKALGWMGIGALTIGTLFFGMPWVIEHAWNNFFSVVFHLPRFAYYNSLALMFWVLVVVGLIALLKE